MEWSEKTARNRLLAGAVVGVLVLGGSVWLVNLLIRKLNEAPVVEEELSDIENPVLWIWAGAATPTSFEVRFCLQEPGEDVSLAVTPLPEFQVWQSFAATRVAGVDGDAAIYRVRPSGLAPGTLYHYAAESLGGFDLPKAGSIELPPQGAHSFSFAFASCAITGSNSPIFDTIRERRPALYLSTGDLHYGNIDRDEPQSFLDYYSWVLRTPRQARLFRSTSVSYVWDDHDYGENDSGRTNPGREAAQQTYRQVVPHHPLVVDDRDEGLGPIHREFDHGRCRFLVLDTRSEKAPPWSPAEQRTMLGATQKAWLFDRLEAAASDQVPVLFLVSSMAWIAAAEEGEDHWAGYADERAEIATHMERLGLMGRTIMLCGDAHMLAADDGRGNRYGKGGQKGFPVLHAAPLDKNPSVKGGPYSIGVHAESGQFGWIDVRDDGGDVVQVAFEGCRRDGSVVLRASFELPRRE